MKTDKFSILPKTEELQQYLKDIKKIPLLTSQEEDLLFENLETLKTNKEKEPIIEKLVKANLRFVVSVAKTYQNQGLDLIDLISEGNIGLIRAVKTFDRTKGFKFISYAVWWIRQSIISGINEYSRTIRVPHNVINENNKLKKKQDDSEPFMVDENDVIAPYIPLCVGLNDEINDEGDQLLDIIPNNNSLSPEHIVNSNNDEIKKKVDNMLSVLDEREKIIIEKYFGLKGVESSLEDLGEEFGCTKERIRQLKDKALKKLRNESYTLLKYIN